MIQYDQDELTTFLMQRGAPTRIFDRTETIKGLAALKSVENQNLAALS
jgi:hypothetical protein